MALALCADVAAPRTRRAPFLARRYRAAVAGFAGEHRARPPYTQGDQGTQNDPHCPVARLHTLLPAFATASRRRCVLLWLLPSSDSAVHRSARSPFCIPASPSPSPSPYRWRSPTPVRLGVSRRLGGEPSLPKASD